MRVIWYTAMSIDGRLADASHSLAFLEQIGDRGEQGSGEWKAFTSRIDGVLIGASTMRWLLDGGHGWPHDDLPTWLVSHDEGLLERIGETREPIRRIEGDLAPAFEQMEQAGCTTVWLCGGGDVAGQALELDRVDEVFLTVAPVAVGNGPVLFETERSPLRRFTLRECAPAGGDAARLVWERDRSA